MTEVKTIQDMTDYCVISEAHQPRSAYTAMMVLRALFTGRISQQPGLEKCPIEFTDAEAYQSGRLPGEVAVASLCRTVEWLEEPTLKPLPLSLEARTFIKDFVADECLALSERSQALEPVLNK
jgi:hypothetical protein